MPGRELANRQRVLKTQVFPLELCDSRPSRCKEKCQLVFTRLVLRGVSSRRLERFMSKHLGKWTMTVAVLSALFGWATPAGAAVIIFTNRTAFDAAFPGAQFQGWDTFAAGTQFPDGTTVGGITYN